MNGRYIFREGCRLIAGPLLSAPERGCDEKLVVGVFTGDLLRVELLLVVLFPVLILSSTALCIIRNPKSITWRESHKKLEQKPESPLTYVTPYDLWVDINKLDHFRIITAISAEQVSNKKTQIDGPYNERQIGDRGQSYQFQKPGNDKQYNTSDQ